MKTEPTEKLTVYIPARLHRLLELEAYDGFRNRPKYGYKSDLIAHLLTVHFQRKENNVSTNV